MWLLLCIFLLSILLVSKFVCLQHDSISIGTVVLKFLGSIRTVISKNVLQFLHNQVYTVGSETNI